MQRRLATEKCGIAADTDVDADAPAVLSLPVRTMLAVMMAETMLRPDAHGNRTVDCGWWETWAGTCDWRRWRWSCWMLMFRWQD